MLIRRATACSSSCSQISLVYLLPSRRNSLFCSRIWQKITKKPIFWGFKIIQSQRCWHF